eukprot:TRINITY_DN13045_c0_g1_i1.p1 TRINITY_DN13045_c0_g1~~TRINITY_DN13045_c0_g1_i1.p1  ORF type:complete len:260 (+),score=71.33 TRINITY_DN13045_c0_g1_i1:84-782(+)
MGLQPSVELSCGRREGPRLSIDGREVWSMHLFPDEVVADLYRQMARRGNPVLAGATDEALLIRGRELALGCKLHPCSLVATAAGRPVALVFACDAAEALPLSPHPSLAAHTVLHHQVDEVRKQELGPLLQTPGQVIDHPFSGILPDYPGVLMNEMFNIVVPARLFLGYKYVVGTAVHPHTVKMVLISYVRHSRLRYRVHPFEDVVLPDGTRPLLGLPPHKAVSTCTELVQTW